jgi:hypothetical protein
MSWGSALGEIRTDTVLRSMSVVSGRNSGKYQSVRNREGILGTHRKTAKVVGARKKWRAQGDSNSRPLAPEANLETLGSWFVYQ